MNLYEGANFMRNDGNLLQLIFDVIWGTGELIVKTFTKEEEKSPLDIFFNKVELCNKDGEYPKVIKTIINGEENIYKVQCPIGLGKSDFQKYSDALEIFLKKEVEMKTSKGYIYIK